MLGIRNPLEMRPGAFRFWLAFIVAASHVIGALAIGTMAVYVFFVLSGYWISLMYTESYSRLKNPYVTFVLSRLFRLYPVYLVAVIFFLTIQLITMQLGFTSPFYEELAAEWGHPSFWLRNLSLLGLSPFPWKILVPAWSLDFEMQFYLLAPLLLWLVARRLRVELLFAVSVAAAVVIALGSESSWLRLVAFLPFFLAGVVIYRRRIDLRGSPIVPACLVAFVMVFLAPFAHPDLYRGIIGGQNYAVGGFNLNAVYNVVLAMLLIPFAASNVHRRSDKTDRTLGSLSYGLYLLHQAWLTPAGLLLQHAGILKLPGSAGYLLISIGSGLLMVRFVDDPFERARKRWLTSLGYGAHSVLTTGTSAVLPPAAIASGAVDSR